MMGINETIMMLEMKKELLTNDLSIWERLYSHCGQMQTIRIAIIGLGVGVVYCMIMIWILRKRMKDGN